MTTENDAWHEFSAISLPPSGFVLAYVEFDDPGATPQLHIAYYSRHDGYWRTRYGRLRGRVTHWRRVDPPGGERT